MTSYDSTFGALVIGGLISNTLFGLFTCQVYVYLKNFPLESKWVRHGLVNGMWVIELVHTICTSHVVYFYAVVHFGDGKTLSTHFPLSFPISHLCEGIITMLVFATETAALYVRKSSIEAFFTEMEWLVTIPLVLRNVVDVIILVTMLYYLKTQRNRSAYKNTIVVVDALILRSIETWAVTRWMDDSDYGHPKDFLKRHVGQYELPDWLATDAVDRDNRERVWNSHIKYGRFYLVTLLILFFD
ncbi:hypothetical protein D9757_009015 [Collybiopsis confluens]|uniref:Uncharacterized protein n=1 Tax=Collybiopsis confluens TaxID=2823264 RepID=A0A8H5M001_9AGAR|nr:hypothetical protein D9757_009015 [Collybiopsis confluens]